MDGWMDRSERTKKRDMPRDMAAAREGGQCEKKEMGLCCLFVSSLPSPPPLPSMYLPLRLHFPLDDSSSNSAMSSSPPTPTQPQTQQQQHDQEEKQNPLTEETALALLQLYLEQAQRGKAFKDVSDAAKVHAALRFLQGKPVKRIVIQKQSQALKFCAEALNFGQAAGVYSLDEAEHIFSLVLFLAAIYDKKKNGEASPKEEFKGKERAAAEWKWGEKRAKA